MAPDLSRFTLDYLMRKSLSELEEIYQSYSTISLIEARELAEEAIRVLADGGDSEDTLHILAAYVDGSLDEVHATLIDREELRPAFLFRGAKQEHAERLVAQLNAMDDQIDPDAVWERVEMLAWIGGAYVESQFSAWAKSPPGWVKHFRDPIISYTDAGGWQLTKSGRRDLFLPKSYRLIPSDNVPPDSPVSVVTQSDDLCPWCHCPLHALFDFNLTSAQLSFMGLAGERLRVMTCLICVNYVPIFFDVDFQGHATWWPGNKSLPHLKHDEGPAVGILENHLALSNLRRTPYESLAGDDDLFASQVGGIPAWVQYADYPTCPGCGDPMVCISQAAVVDFVDEPGEGFYYAFLCKDCRRTAVNYQQS